MQCRSDNITTVEPDCKARIMVKEGQGKGRGEREGRIKRTGKS